MRWFVAFVALIVCGQHVAMATICSTASNNTVVCGGHGTCFAGLCTCAIQYSAGNSLTAAGALGTTGVLATYAVVAATTITNSGSTVLRGNSGVHSQNAISGTAMTYAGGSFAFHAHDASVNNSFADAVAASAYFNALGDSLGVPATALGGRTLPPGVRSMASGATLAGTLTLDFQNDPSAIFVFKITGSLSTSASSHVALVNAAGSIAGTTNAVVMGVASTYVVIAATPSITNSGPTELWGNVAIHPASSVTGSPIVHGGTTNAGNAAALTAKTAASTGRDTLNAMPPTSTIGPELGGTTVTPGVYHVLSPTLISNSAGHLTLSGAGVYVFQLDANLIVESSRKVILTNGARSCQIFWTVASGVALGTTSVMYGTIIAETTVAINTGARVNGTVVSLTAAVTLLSNYIDAGGGTCGSSSTSVPCTNCACRVFWTTTTTATLGATSTFAGSLLAAGAVSVGANTRVEGRLASLTAGVTLNNNYVNTTSCSSLVSTCAPCAAGSHGLTPNVCANCPIGKYKATAVAAACSVCYDHSNSTTTGTTTCTCKAGYSGNTVPLECHACALGKWKSAVGNGACTNCTGAHVSTATTASLLAADCKCAKGFFSADGLTGCKGCDQGSYTDEVGSTECTNCTTDESAAIGYAAESCAACPLGFTNNTRNSLCDIDIDECTDLVHVHNCTQTCTNTVGGFTCSCLDGFTTDDYGVTCLNAAGAGDDSYNGRVLLITAGSVAGFVALAAWASTGFKSFYGGAHAAYRPYVGTTSL